MQISYLLGLNSKSKLNDIARSMTSQTNYNKREHEKTLLASIAALSLLLLLGCCKYSLCQTKCGLLRQSF